MFQCVLPLSMAKHTGFNTVFRFKEFTLHQGNEVFRLGTDAVLLGCWAHLSVQGGPILDVGTGTGALALMAAQRTSREILGIDISAESVNLAQKNANLSPWSSRIRMLEASIESFQPEVSPYDILMNPPYFLNHTPNARADLSSARHGSSDLPMRWFGSPAFLNMEQGNIHMIIPSSSFLIWEKAWKHHGWFLNRHLRVQGRYQGPIIRSVLGLSRTQSRVHMEEMYVYELNGDRSVGYRNLSAQFYL